MKVPTLENNRVKLSLLDLSNCKHLTEVGKQANLVQYSPTKIHTPEDLKAYVHKAVDGNYHKTVIPLLYLINRPIPMLVIRIL